MATQSIFDNIVINTKEEAENFVRAVEEAEKLAETIPFVEVPSHTLTKEEYKQFFGEK